MSANERPVVTPSATLRDAVAKFVRLAAAWNLSVDQATDRVMAVLAEHDIPRALAVLAAVDGAEVDEDDVVMQGVVNTFFADTLLAALRSIKGTP